MRRKASFKIEKKIIDNRKIYAQINCLRVKVPQEIESKINFYQFFGKLIKIGYT